MTIQEFELFTSTREVWLRGRYISLKVSYSTSFEAPIDQSVLAIITVYLIRWHVACEQKNRVVQIYAIPITKQKVLTH